MLAIALADLEHLMVQVGLLDRGRATGAAGIIGVPVHLQPGVRRCLQQQREILAPVAGDDGVGAGRLDLVFAAVNRLAFKPDSRATLIKLRPRPTVGFSGTSSGKNARECSGRARARTLSRDNTIADLLRDRRNVRREEDKRAVPSRGWRARIRPYFIQCIATLQG